MSIAVTRYLPTADELEAEARNFEREGGAELGPLHALLVERIRLKMLEREYTERIKVH